jgi:hypothetical protein
MAPLSKDHIAVAQITTYALIDNQMHRRQYTQLTLKNKNQLQEELVKIIKRYPEAFTTSIYIEWRPFVEWPKKWREV